LKDVIRHAHAKDVRVLCDLLFTNGEVGKNFCFFGVYSKIESKCTAEAEGRASVYFPSNWMISLEVK